MGMIRKSVLLACVGLTLAGCSVGGRLLDGRETYDGAFFRARLVAERDGRQNFTVEVPRASQTLAGAREAGRHKAVQHCITYFGNSYIDWAQGPDVEDSALVLAGDALRLRGRCRGW